jgi:Flp pilus assembly protein TadG
MSTKSSPVTLQRDQLHSRSRKGVELIEFAIVMPLLIFIILFSIDMGRNIFVAGTLQDAVYISARTGAQVGGANIGGTPHAAFNSAFANIPGAASGSVTWTVTSGGTCTLSGANTYVIITATYPEQFVTPGLGAALSVVTGAPPHITAVGVARCEVVR